MGKEPCCCFMTLGGLIVVQSREQSNELLLTMPLVGIDQIRQSRGGQ